MNITFLGNFNVNYTSETHHANTLEMLGHGVVRLQEGQTLGQTVLNEALKSDLLIIVHTHGWNTPGLPLAEVLQRLKGQVKTLTYHLDLWFGLKRQEDLNNDPFYKLIDYFFCTDKLMADWFNTNTQVKGHYLPAGVYAPECFLVPTQIKNDIVFTGSKGYHPEWPWRPTLINWLQDTYKEGFKHYGNDGIRVVRGYELNKVYAESKITIGDTLCIDFKYPYYFSDRLFETTGRGAFVIFPYIKGIEDLFVIEGDKQEIVTFTFGDFKDLKSKIDYYLTHDSEREAIRQRGLNRTRNEHTYLHRWATILEIINK